MDSELPLTAYFSKSKRKLAAAEHPAKRTKARNTWANSTHLHTPATATRKHDRKTRANLASSKKPTVSCDIDLTLSDSETPPQASPKDGEVAHSLPTPSSSNELARNKLLNVNHRTSYTCLPTPRTTAQKLSVPKPAPPSLECSPTDNRLRSFKSCITPAVTLHFSHTKHSVSNDPVPLDKSTSNSRVTADDPDTSTLDDNDPFALPVDKRPPGPYANRRMVKEPTLEIPTTEVGINTLAHLVPSSQSQYLLPLEATPTRNRIHRHDDIVPGSQTQEEGELFVGMPPYSFHKNSTTESTARHSSTTDSSALAHRLTPSVSTSQATPPEPNVASQQHLDRSPVHRSPTRHKQALQHRACARSHPPSSCTLSREDSMNVPPVLGDDSATEPESDSEILNCVAAIRKRQAERAPILSPPRIGVSRAQISPLVSPVRRRYTPEPSISGSLDALMQDGAGMSIPATYISSGVDQRRLGRRSESFPSVVRDFMDMFTGDGSYPDDFPESLRI
ncbi:hypothetical protein V8B97DRAFT_1926530 [Scleroderma yunnanense]